MAKAIGVIGGVGPYAGLDVVRKVFDNTIAASDQEHIDLYLTSTPRIIADRTGYLLNGGENPAEGIWQCFDKLASLGADVIIIPCNTAHAPPIYDEVAKKARKAWPQVVFLNMIDETVKEIARRFPDSSSIGLLATLGTHALALYRRCIEGERPFEVIEPDEAGRKAVHQAIYDREWGIKATATPSAKARAVVRSAANALIEQGSDAIILGCTELPLALTDGELSVPLIDPTAILARAAIAHVAAQKLRPLS